MTENELGPPKPRYYCRQHVEVGQCGEWVAKAEWNIKLAIESKHKKLPLAVELHVGVAREALEEARKWLRGCRRS